MERLSNVVLKMGKMPDFELLSEVRTLRTPSCTVYVRKMMNKYVRGQLFNKSKCQNMKLSRVLLPTTKQNLLELSFFSSKLEGHKYT